MIKEGEELQELKHEAVPGGKAVFYLVTAIAVLYLIIIFTWTL